VPACGRSVEVESNGQRWRERVELTPYETTKLSGTLGGARKKAIAVPSDPNAGQWKGTAGKWALYGGLGVLATGATFAALASSAGSDIKTRHDSCVSSGNAGDCPSQADVDAAYGLSTLGNVGIYGGATLSLLGAYWLMTAPSDEKPRALELRVGPSSISVGVQF